MTETTEAKTEQTEHDWNIVVEHDWNIVVEHDRNDSYLGLIQTVHLN
jgi:hypothetical protein